MNAKQHETKVQMKKELINLGFEIISTYNQGLKISKNVITRISFSN